MLDYRLKTFLVLGQTLNYTRTAELLHMSQPAVSQQIRYLEQHYGFKLLEYSNRHLGLTELGQLLYQKVVSLENESQSIIKELSAKKSEQKTIRFDCTFTFGEYILPSLLCKWFKKNPSLKICIRIKSTQECLDALNRGEVDFILVEGFFNKAGYNYKLVKKTHMGLVVPPNHPLVSKECVKLQDLLQYTLVIRQKKSRERGILPSGLAEHNYSYDSFADLIQCGSMNVMKELIKNDCGIGFLHEDVIRKDLQEGTLKEININDFKLIREMNMIYHPKYKNDNSLDWVYNDLISHINNSN